MSDVALPLDEVAAPERGFNPRDLFEQLIDAMLSSPIGFILGALTLLIAGIIGFCFATLVMPVWLWRRRKYIGAVGAAILLLTLVVAVAAPIIQPTDTGAVAIPPYAKGNLSARLTAPSSDHVFGTDQQGRDIVTRIVYGAEVTILVGLGTVIATAVISTVVGVASGFFAGESLTWRLWLPGPLGGVANRRDPGGRLLRAFVLLFWIPVALALATVLRIVDLAIALGGGIAALPLRGFHWAVRALSVVGLVDDELGAPARRVDDRLTSATSSPLSARAEAATSNLPYTPVGIPNVDTVLQRVVDVWVAFPAIFMILAIVAIFGSGGTGFFGLGRGPDFGPQATASAEWIWQVFPNTTVMIITLSLVLAGGNSRVVRGAVLSIKAEQYIESARSLGAANSRVMAAHILPNIVPVIVILATLNLGVAVLAEAAISFLGFGIPPPFPTWGQDLGGLALVYGQQAWWLAVFPGVAITVAVFGFNMMGDALRDLLDPRLRGTQ